MSRSSSLVQRALSIIASVAMVVTGVSIVAVTPANAVETTPSQTVTGNDIRPNEDTYAGWHEGYPNSERAYSVQADGLHLGDGSPSQILNGLTRPRPISAADLGSLITSAVVETKSGLATLQVPMFFGPLNPQAFTTLYSADVKVGTNAFSLDSQFVTTHAIGAVKAGTQDTLANLLSALEAQDAIRLLGFGVQADASTVVPSMTWDGTQYVFTPYVAAAPSTQVTVNQRDTASEIEQNDPTLPGYNYEMWHEGTNAIGYAVKSDGVHLGVSSRSTFIKGTTVNKVEEADDNLVSQADLQELISKASVKVAGTGTVSFQIPLHFGNNGSDVRALGNSFTTLLIRNLDAGNHTFSLTDQWSSSRTTGPFIGFEDHALGDLLDDLYATYDYVWLAGFGVQADLQETTAIVPSLVWDGTEYTFTQPETSTCAVTNPGTTTTNLDSNGWSFARTRATGHNEFVDNGLRVWTDGTDGTTNKVAGDHPITFDLPLADVGVPSIDLTNYAAEATSIPGFQLGVDFDNDGTQDGYLVGEVANGDQWWASASIVSNATWVGLPVPAPGTSSRTISGTLDQYLVAYPHARATSYGYSLGSNVIGDSIIHSITVGCTVYGFDVAAAAEPAQTVNVSDAQIQPDELPAGAEGYVGWHESYSDPDGNPSRNYSTAADGLHLGHEFPSVIINGLATQPKTALEQLITSASIKVVAGSVTFQVPIYYGTAGVDGPDGTASFTTLRSESLTAADNTFSVSDNWRSSRALVNNVGEVVFNANTSYPVADLVSFITAQGDLTINGSGVQADAHADAVVQDLVFDGTKTHFVATSQVTPTDTVRVTEPEIGLTETSENYTAWHQGYPNQEDDPTFSVVEDGLSLADGSHSQILKGLTEAVAGSDLYNILTSEAELTVVSGNATYQVAVNFDKANVKPGWSTIRSASLDAGDHTFSLTDQWYSSKDIGTTIRGDEIVDGVKVFHPYPLGDILDAMNSFGDAEAIGFGVQAEAPAVVESIVWGGTEYDFDGPIEGTHPVITGTPQVGHTLTVEPGAWTPEGVALHYQWTRSGEHVGTDSTTYALTPADATKTISVAVTGSKSGYADVTEIADGTADIGEGDLTAGTPEITGAAQVGQVLTVLPGTWDNPTVTDFTYEWIIDGDVVSTTTTYIPVVDDIGKIATVKVKGSLNGYLDKVVPVDSAKISGSAIVTIPPTITGTAQVGQALTVDEGTWSPEAVAFSYQWRVGGLEVPGATQDTYTPVAADLAKTVTVTVTGATTDSIPVSVTSDPTAAVIKGQIILAGASITGTAQVGETLTAVAGAVTPAGVAFHYVWSANGVPITGEIDSTLTLAAAQEGSVVSVRITAATAGYNDASSISTETAKVAAGVLAAGAVSIDGTVRVGEVLTANVAASSPAGATLAYEWSVGTDVVDGATSATYTVRAADFDKTVTLKVTGSLAGYLSATQEATTAKVAAGALTAGAVTVTGTVKVGETLTAHIAESTPAGADATFQWFVGDATVAAATGATYTPVVADYDKTITVKATSTLRGYANASSELTTSKVGAGGLTAGAVTVTGTVKVGEPLTAHIAESTPAGATSTFEWFVGNDATAAATGTTYAPDTSDYGQTITVKATSTLTGYADVPSQFTTAKVAAASLTAGTPTITGTVQIGQTLTAHPGTWAPSGVTLAYQWRVDGAAIAGASHSTYTPTADTLDKTISVTVTGSLFGYTTQSTTSFGTADVAAATAVTSREFGADRYATAVAISSNFASGVPVVYVATGTNYADALSAAPAAAHLGGPLLLTPTAGLPSNVKAEIQRLKPAKIVVVGGPSVVSNSVLSALKKVQSNTVRVYGADRYDTSRLIAATAFKSASTAYIATGLNFPDALSASAAAGAVDGPVVLVKGTASSVDTATKSLLRSLHVVTVKIAGGSAVVSNGIAKTLDAMSGVSVQRLAGSDRYATSVAINADAFRASSVVYLAVGTAFADALAGAALAGNNGAPLYVVPATCVPVSVVNAIRTLGASNVVLFGGAGALSKSVANLSPCK